MLSTRDELSYPEIASIFEDVFEHQGPVTPATCPTDVAHWDSLHHLALVRRIETTFGVALSMDEMMEIQSVRDIETILARHGV